MAIGCVGMGGFCGPLAVAYPNSYNFTGGDSQIVLPFLSYIPAHTYLAEILQVVGRESHCSNFHLA